MSCDRVFLEDSKFCRFLFFRVGITLSLFCLSISFLINPHFLFLLLTSTMTADQESKTDQDVERFLIRTIQKRFYQSVPCSEVIDLIQQNYEFLWDPASQLSPDSDNTSIMKYFPSIELYPDESTGRLYCRLAPSSTSTVDNNGNKDFFGNKENHQASVSRVFCLAYVEETILQFIDTQPNKCIAYSVLPTFYNQKWGSFKKTGRKLGYKKFEKMITSFRSMETFTKNKRTMLSRRRSENMSLVPKSIDCGSRLPKKRRRRSSTTLLVDASRNMEHASKGAYTNMSPSKLSPKSISSVLVDTYEMLEELSHQAPFQVSCASKSTCNGETVHKDIVAMDCIGDPQDLYLIQVATENTVYMLDCVALDSISVYQLIRDMLLNQSVLKLFHDVYNSAAVFAALGGVDDLPQGTLDTQVLMESMTGQCHSGLLEMLEHFGIYPQSKSLADRATMDSKLFALRPIPPKLVQHYVDKVRFLLDIPSKILLSSESTLNKYMRLSDARVQSAAQSGGVRHVVFDKDNSYKLASYEVLHDTRPTGIALQRNLVVSEDIDSLLCLLKSDLSDTIAGQTDDLSDIVLDKGRRAVCWIKGKRVVLASEDRIVDDADIDHVVTTVGDFGNDNRAGIERQLHRISAVRNRKNEIVGLTLRVGRHIVGNADIIRDLLFQDTSASILFLGEPGSGKTSKLFWALQIITSLFFRYSQSFVFSHSCGSRSDEIIGRRIQRFHCRY
jgi:hypothetical protein